MNKHVIIPIIIGIGSFIFGVGCSEVVRRSKDNVNLGSLCIEHDNKKVENIYLQLNYEPDFLLDKKKVTLNVVKLDKNKKDSQIKHAL